jgi:hypothetical protein
MKDTAVWYRYSKDPALLQSAHQRVSIVDTYHGQASGIFSCSEHLAGLDPSQGTETCTVVETMFSFEVLFSVFGDVSFAESLVFALFFVFAGVLAQDPVAEPVEAAPVDAPVAPVFTVTLNPYGTECVGVTTNANRYCTGVAITKACGTVTIISNPNNETISNPSVEISASNDICSALGLAAGQNLCPGVLLPNGTMPLTKDVFCPTCYGLIYRTCTDNAGCPGIPPTPPTPPPVTPAKECKCNCLACKSVPAGDCNNATAYDQANAAGCGDTYSGCNTPIAPPKVPGAAPTKSSATTFAPVFAFLALTVLAVVF